jgi:hypothetical protein
MVNLSSVIPIQYCFIIILHRTYMASDIQVLNEEVALSLARSAIIGFNYNVNALARLIFFSSWLNSLKFMGFLFLFSYITNYLSIIINMFLGKLTSLHCVKSFITDINLVINLLFFVPPFYSRHRVSCCCCCCCYFSFLSL